MSGILTQRCSFCGIVVAAEMHGPVDVAVDVVLHSVSVKQAGFHVIGP